MKKKVEENAKFVLKKKHLFSDFKIYKLNFYYKPIKLSH